jgi:hypothetical protein
MILAGCVCVVGLGGCSTESSSSADSTPGGSSPVIVPPTDASNPPVTMSGYLDSSVTSQVK